MCGKEGTFAVSLGWIPFLFVRQLMEDRKHLLRCVACAMKNSGRVRWIASPRACDMPSLLLLDDYTFNVKVIHYIHSLYPICAEDEML